MQLGLFVHFRASVLAKGTAEVLAYLRSRIVEEGERQNIPN